MINYDPHLIDPLEREIKKKFFITNFSCNLMKNELNSLTIWIHLKVNYQKIVSLRTFVTLQKSKQCFIQNISRTLGYLNFSSFQKKMIKNVNLLIYLFWMTFHRTDLNTVINRYQVW